MTNYDLHPITEDELDALYLLYKEFAEYENLVDYFTATKDDFRAMIFEERNITMLLIKVDQRIIGFVAYYFTLLSFPGKKVLYLEDIYLQKEYRGNGIGTDIIKKLEKIAAEHNCLRVEWKCLRDRFDTQEFYEKQIGAVSVDDFITYYKVVK